MRKKRNGFTLIELLAVLVILTIIALIAVPLVSNIIMEARKKTFEENVKRVFYAFSLYKASEEYDPEKKNLSVTDKELALKTTLKSGIVFDNAQKKAEVDNITDGVFCAKGLEESFEVIKGECRQLDSTPATFKLNINAITTNSIKVSIEAQDLESGIKGYKYSSDGGKTYTELTTDNVYTYKNLKNGTLYQIKIIVVNGNDVEAISEIKEVETMNVDKPSYLMDKEGWQQDKTVTITYPTGTGLTYSYSLDRGTSWNNANQVEKVKFTNNGTLIARVSDGSNNINGTTLMIEQIDNTVPTIDTITPNTIGYDTSIVLTVNAGDDESGLADKAYSYDGGNTWVSTNKQTYTSAGTFSIQVKDKANNITTKQVKTESQTQYKVNYTETEWIWYRDSNNSYPATVLTPPTCTDAQLESNTSASCLCTDEQKENQTCRKNKDLWSVNRSTSFRAIRINLGTGNDCAGSGASNSSSGSYNIASGFGTVRNMSISFWNSDASNNPRAANMSIATSSGSYSSTNSTNNSNLMINTRSKYADAKVTSASISNAGSNTTSYCWSVTMRIEAYEKQATVSKVTLWQTSQTSSSGTTTGINSTRIVYRYIAS